MLRKTLNIVSIVLACSLVTYAISESLPAKNDKAAGKTRKFARGTGPQGAWDRERDVVNKLCLTDEQYRGYANVKMVMKADVEEMMKLKTGHMERGAQLNRKMHEGLERVFTPIQYATYIRLWYTGAEPSTRGHVTSYAGADERILKEIGISKKQWDEYDALQGKVTALDEKIKASVDKSDPSLTDGKGEELNRLNREGMKKLLTPSQHKQWTEKWYEFAKVTPSAVGAAKKQRDAINRGESVVFGPARLHGGGGGSSTGAAAAGGG